MSRSPCSGDMLSILYTPSLTVVLCGKNFLQLVNIAHFCPVILEHFDQVVGDCFMDCVNCLIAFANNKISPRTSLKSIALLRICEDRLAEVNKKSGVIILVETRVMVAPFILVSLNNLCNVEHV